MGHPQIVRKVKKQPQVLRLPFVRRGGLRVTQNDIRFSASLKMTSFEGHEDIYGSLKAFTAMALGLRPVGSKVKSDREAVRTTATSADRESTTKSR